MVRIIDGSAMNLIGDNVRKYRIAPKMSQQALSDKLERMTIDVCRGGFSRIARTVTDIALFGLASALGVTIEALFDFRDQKRFLIFNKLRSQ